MWLNWVEWYVDYRPDLLTKEEVENIPLFQYFKIHKSDHDGRPVVLMAPGDEDIDLNIDD